MRVLAFRAVALAASTLMSVPVMAQVDYGFGPATA